MKNHKCQFCELRFSTLIKLYQHRIGSGKERVCMSDIQLFHAGFRFGVDIIGKEVLAKDKSFDEFLINKEIQTRKTRITIEKRLPSSVSAAKYCFERGVSPAKMLKSGMSFKSIDDAIRLTQNNE